MDRAKGLPLDGSNEKMLGMPKWMAYTVIGLIAFSLFAAIYKGVKISKGSIIPAAN